MDAEQFGQYRLEQLIGRGGMGEVFRAYDTVRGRVVALKRLPAHLAADKEFQARFRKESALASRLSEPHIIPIHDFGEIDGRLYIDMRYVQGMDLGAVLAEHGPLVPERAAAVVAQVATALDAAHADGLVHRDVKPSNLLLTGDMDREFVYLLDFGIARSVGSGGETSLTVTGATVGTLDYMAPERFLETGCDHRVDVYSLACVLFEALTGRKPFRGDGLPAMIHAHMSMEAPKPSRERPSVPAALDAVVAKGMAKKPEDRYQSARALADAALAAVRGEPAADQATRVVNRPAVVPGRMPNDGHRYPGQPQRPAPTYPPQRPPQAAPPPAQTMVGLPSAGFRVPGDTGPSGANATTGSRRSWPIVAVAVAVVAVVVIGIVIAAPLIGAGGTSTPPSNVALPGTSTTVPPTTVPPTTVPPQDNFVRPASLPGGDPTADQALWDSLKGTGVVWDQCEYTDSAVTTTESYLLCEPASPTLDRRLGFEGYATAGAATDEVDGYSRILSGDPGTCDAGGRFVGTVLGREVACGYFTFDDGSTAYFIVWTKTTAPVLGAAADTDPAKTWEWFSGHDPF